MKVIRQSDGEIGGLWKWWKISEKSGTRTLVITLICQLIEERAKSVGSNNALTDFGIDKGEYEQQTDN